MKRVKLLAGERLFQFPFKTCLEGADIGIFGIVEIGRLAVLHREVVEQVENIVHG